MQAFKPLLEDLRASIPDCAAAAIIDLETGRVHATVATEQTREQLHEVVRMAPELFRQDADHEAPENDEIVILGPDQVWLLMHRTGSLIIVTCGAKANLGALVARVRATAANLENAA